MLLLSPAVTLLLKDVAARKAPPAFVSMLWEYCAQSLLDRSSRPPEPPADWSQPVKIACTCADCRDLQSFTKDPEEQVHRFRINQDRRHHLHGKIEEHG